MRSSVWPNPQQPWQGVLDVAGHAESTGWDGVWFADHFMPLGDDVSQPTLECWSVLAALAAAVPRVRIGALVSGNTYRHPAEVTEAIAAYPDAGVDEFIVPDFTLGSGQRKLDTLDLFINEVAPSFR